MLHLSLTKQSNSDTIHVELEGASTVDVVLSLADIPQVRVFMPNSAVGLSYSQYLGCTSYLSSTYTFDSSTCYISAVMLQ